VALPHGLPPFTTIRKALWQSQRTENKQHNHAVATPSIPQNPECSASDKMRGIDIIHLGFIPEILEVYNAAKRGWKQLSSLY